MSEDTFFMNIALDLAQKGMGFVSPNPMVGAVIVKNGLISIIILDSTGQKLTTPD